MNISGDKSPPSSCNESESDNAVGQPLGCAVDPSSNMDNQVAGPSNRGKQWVVRNHRKCKQTAVSLIDFSDSDSDASTNNSQSNNTKKQPKTIFNPRKGNKLTATNNRKKAKVGKNSKANVGKDLKAKNVTKKKTGKNKKEDRNIEANRLWKEFDETFQHPNSNIPFVEYVGLKRAASAAESPLECLRLFITDDILEQIVAETNRYYQQQNANNPSTMKWHDLSYVELLAFLGVILSMGMIKFPEINFYWRKQSIFEMPWFSLIFTRFRFKQILRYLHLSNNENDLPHGNPDRDKLFKLGMLPSILSNKFYDMYAPRREISIDEQMIGTKSRVSFIQYMPKKPKKFGIKVWALCDSLTGYCLQFQIYTGKVNDSVEHGLSYRVVFDLLEKFLNKNYRVYFDNFYTSYKLLNDLDQKQTYACGTLRKGRAQLPDEFENAKMQPGQSIYRKRNNIVAVHWKDKRDVLCLSAFHTLGEQVIERFGGAITKPNIICDYNIYMGGVDKCDQFLSYYSLCSRKSSKWWKKVFLRMFELSVVNAMCIYSEKHPIFAKSRSAHQRFREALILEMVQPLLDQREENEQSRNTNNPEPRPNRRKVVSTSRLKGKHYSSKHKSRRKCSKCAYIKNPVTGKRRDTKTFNFCKKCNLHICEKCFKVFHSKLNLKNA